MTDVSRTPRATRCTATGFDALIGDSVEVVPEPFAVDGQSCLEELCDGLRGHEAEAPQFSLAHDLIPVGGTVDSV